MSDLQLFFIGFTFVAPFLLWFASKRARSKSFDLWVSRTLALVLICAFLGEFGVKIISGDFSPEHALPLQLCDWALFAVAGALWFGWQTGFELGYFWGLAGTIQALFTPALHPGTAEWRVFGFFLVHSIIVVGVLYLMLARGFRPRSLVRVIVWSEIFFVCALTANALFGSNYGFLARKPEIRSMLDLFSDTHWIYVLQLNLTGLVVFTLFYLPWWRRPAAADPASA